MPGRPDTLLNLNDPTIRARVCAGSLAEAAADLKVSRTTVKRCRDLLGAVATPTETVIPVAVLKRLGTCSDAQLAHESGVDVDVLRRRRLRLNIPAFSCLEQLLQDPASVSTIKLLSVVDAAAALQVSRPTIQAVRERLGLGPSPRGRPRECDFTRKRTRKLGRFPDTVLSAEYSVSTSTVRRRRLEAGKPAYPRGAEPTKLPIAVVRRLGQDTDANLAARAGVSADTIRRARLRRDIPAFDPGDA